MASKTFERAEILGLYTETSLHCGAESGTGYVDLPIQRERHTRYPVIQGSTLKGVLRDEAWPGLDGDERKKKVTAAFGSKPGKPDDVMLPGTVSFGDGILAAFPVRSTGAPFHWVTCPFVLERVLRLLGKSETIPAPAAHHAWGKEKGTVLLEDLRVIVQTEATLYGDQGPLTNLLSLLPAADRGFAYTRDIFLSRLLVVTDDDFRELVETGTEVVTRIKLNYLGTTRNLKKEREQHEGVPDEDLEGNLFVEELVPPETLFVSAVRAAGDISDLLDKIPPVIRLGGDETIGRGLTHVTRVPAAEGGQ